MHWNISPKPGLRAGLSLLLLGTAMYVAGITWVRAADSKPATEPKKEQKAQKKPDKKKKLSGAELYAMHCNRCHPERYATERTEAQWKTIMLHMRVRAYLPADQAKAIVKYLQEDNTHLNFHTYEDSYRSRNANSRCLVHGVRRCTARVCRRR
jgi:hypothetical protein